MPYCTRDGVRLHYVTAGEGPAFVLIHANPFDHTLFRYQIAKYSTRFRVIAVDLRGYGRSDPITTEYRFEDLNEDVLAICATEKVKEAIVMGVSVGSTMGLAMALDRPDLVKALIAVGGGANKSDRATSRIDNYRSKGLDYHREHLESLVAPDFPKTPLGRYIIGDFLERGRALKWKGHALARVLEALSKADLIARLPSLKVPTLIINGAHDHSLPRGKATAGLIPSARHAVLADTGHACCIEDPEGFDELVYEFLLDIGKLPADAP
jgi:3-oxoadipate enol-lactonase